MGHKIKIQTLVKGLLILPLMGLLMGNTGCQEEQVVNPRQLKKIVDLGPISASPLVVPGGGSFDFKFVANQQIYGVLAESAGFALKYLPALSTASSTVDVTSNLSTGDQSLMMKVASNTGSNGVVNWSKEATCMVNLPSARLYGSVNSFVMTGGGGLTIGFTPAGSFSSVSGNANFQVEYAQLDLSMIGVNALTNGTISAVNVDSKQTKTAMNANISLLSMFNLGPSYYYQTPLATVTKKALTLAVEGLKKGFDKEVWSTRALANMDTHITIIGGTNVNLQKGDELEFYNELHYWDGEPCSSVYRGGVATEAVASGTVEYVGEDISIVKLTKQTDENVVVGAKVQLVKLADPVAK